MHKTDPTRTALDRLVPWLLGIITVAVLAATVLWPMARTFLHSLQVVSDTLAPAAAQAIANLLGGQ